MKFTLVNVKELKNSALGVPLLAGLVLLWVGSTFAADAKSGQGPSRQQCHGLHAGIRAELVRQKPPFTQPSYVMLTFLLVNDSEASVDVAPETWAVVINGKETKDSGMLLGNGPVPADGWKALKPGDHYEFGRGLELARYFPQSGEHQVSWKGQNFESATIIVKI
jgi:hypothetical protein